MKTLNTKHTVLRLIVTCFLGAAIIGPAQAATPKPKSGRDAVATTGSSTNPGRLIIRRIPTLGNEVVVDLYIDGVATSAIVYSQTYEAALTPGRHVLSVIAGPHPTWPVRSEMTLDVQNGQTYSFTAASNGSGNLILRGA